MSLSFSLPVPVRLPIRSTSGTEPAAVMNLTPLVSSGAPGCTGSWTKLSSLGCGGASFVVDLEKEI